MDKKNKVIALWSPVSGVGVTFTGINMAKLIGERGARVALFDFDLKTPATHIYLDNKDSVHCIDNVIPFTVGNSLPAEVIENNIQKVEDFYYLRGTNSPNQAQYVSVESLTAILDVAKELYDYIIVDTHSTIDNAGTYVALKKADKVFLVTEKNAITIQHFNLSKNLLIENIGMDNFKLIINKAHKNIYLEKKDIETYYEIIGAHELPFLGEAFINAINQGRWLSYLYSLDKTAKRYVELLEELIVNEINPSLENTKKDKKKGFSLFKKR